VRDVVVRALTLNYYSTRRLLFIDDLGIVTTGAGWFGAMGQIIQYRESHFLPTVVTTNLDGATMAKMYGDRTASRFKSGNCIRIEAPDFRGKQVA
jgi:DNA replication protein DnaC